MYSAKRCLAPPDLNLYGKREANLQQRRLVAEDFLLPDSTVLEQTLIGMGDIRAARVVLSKDQRSIDEIHVLANGEKSPKQLARDVESALLAEYGMAIDRRKISIAQIASEKVSREMLRPKIGSVVVDTSGPEVTVHVTLEISGGVYRGTAGGGASRTGRLRLVAMATIDAIHQVGNGSLSFVLEDVSFVKMVGRKIALVCLAMVYTSGEQVFCGSALVGENYKDSIVRATMDAVNRRLAMS